MIATLLFLAAVAMPSDRPHHFIIQPEHVLRAEEIAELAAKGVEVQRVLPDHRYLVRAAESDLVERDPRFAKVEAFGASKKIARSAIRAAARGNAFTTVRLLFHNDVAFDDAEQALTAIGGAAEKPLTFDFELPHGMVARIPSTAPMSKSESTTPLPVRL